MNFRKNFLFLSILLAGAAFTKAQTADEIIAKHLEAIGGKEKLNAITAVRLENTVQIMGTDAPSSTVIVNGKGFRNDSEFNGQKMVQVYTDKSGWAINPMTGSEDAQAMPEDQLKSGQDQIYVIPFLDYASRGSKAELMGQEKIGKINAYKIKMTSKDNTAATYYFDPSTYYIIQVIKSAEMMGQQMEITTTLSDYKKLDYGWVVPEAMEMNFGGQFSMTSKVQKVEVNPVVDPALFEMK